MRVQKSQAIFSNAYILFLSQCLEVTPACAEKSYSVLGKHCGLPSEKDK